MLALYRQNGSLSSNMKRTARPTSSYLWTTEREMTTLGENVMNVVTELCPLKKCYDDTLAPDAPVVAMRPS